MTDYRVARRVVQERDLVLLGALVQRRSGAIVNMLHRWLEPRIPIETIARWPLPDQTSYLNDILVVLTNRDAQFRRAAEEMLGRTPTPARLTGERRTAYHEAGHAIVAMELGIPFTDVTIHGTAAVAGGLMLSTSFGGHIAALVLPMTPYSGDWVLEGAKYIRVLMAGSAAEEVACGGPSEGDSATGDLEAIESFLSHGCAPDAATVHTYRAGLKADTLRLLQTHRDSLEAVAHALLRRGRLTSDDVIQLCGGPDDALGK